MYLLLFIWLMELVLGFGVKLANRSVERPKRELGIKYLVFPEGSNVQLVNCLTISTYSKPTGMFTIGVTAGLAWELPSKVLDDEFYRRSRRDLYHKVERMLQSQGKDGRACVLKAICKAEGRERSNLGKGSFLEEVLHSVFTLPDGSHDIDPITEYERAYLWRENCNEVLDRCPDVF